VQEPEGRLDLARATYAAIDDRRTRVVGAVWHDARETWVKIEGARPVGERAILLCGTADPRFIARHEQLLKEIEGVVRDAVCEDAPEDYVLTWRLGPSVPPTRAWTSVHRRPRLRRSPCEAALGLPCTANQLILRSSDLTTGFQSATSAARA
jgi:hypothetical protein